MKLTFLFFVTLTFAMQAHTSYSQKTKLSLNMKDSTVEEVLNTIEAKTEFKFFYRTQAVDLDRRITVEVKNTPIEDILKQIFSEGNTTFDIDDRTILLWDTVKDPKRVNNEVETFQYEVNGTVTDANGIPLPGANIIEKGTSNGITTDMDGKFSMTVGSENAVLEVSYMGFTIQEVEVNGALNLNIVLEEDMAALDEVVVIGYGQVLKRDLTGSVSNVSGEDVANIPVSRVDQTLQGRAAGVQVSQVSGEPGAATSIRIRGGNSIQGNNQPLWVIDGIIVGTDFNLNNINSNDIKSIDVLKDAVAVSIYGTRGANGVILVTTKNGAGIGGETHVSLNVYSGIQSQITTGDFLNGRQHAEYANEDAAFRGAALPFQDLDAVPDTDWMDEVTRSAPIYNADVSVSGTSKEQNVNYYISGNYFNQRGLVRASGIEKFIFRTNLDIDLSEKFKTGVRVNISRLKRDHNKVNISDLFRIGVPSRAIYDENGEYTALNPVSGSIRRNPVADIDLITNERQITNILGSLYLEYKPVENLILKSTFSPELNYYERSIYRPSTLPNYAIVDAGGNARIDNFSSFGYINENTVTWNKNIGEQDRLTVLAGFTVQQFRANDNTSEAYEFSNDVTGFYNIGFGSNPGRNVVNSDYDEFSLVSWLGRINYSVKDKYLFTLVGRVDGSSRFAPGNKYALFPSAAFAWKLSEEEFIKNLGVFDNLKLRASYGLSGSQAIESFRTLALLDAANNTLNGVEQPGVTLGRPANPDLKWETTRQFDIGLEAGFFNNRLSLEVDYYQKNTTDLLLNTQIPRQTGFVNQLKNLGELQNTGLEFLVNSINVDNDDFNWSTSLSITHNKNKVLDLGGVPYINLTNQVSAEGQGGPGGRLIVGESAPVFTGVNYLGTWKSQEEIDASGMQGSHDVGGPRFEDTNGDKIISEEDFIVLGNPEPDFYFGFGNTFSYKNLELDFFFQGTYGNEVFNALTQTAFFGRSENTKYAETINRWSPDNPNSDIPRAGAVAAISEVWNNSEMVEDASHIRLKSFRLAYNLPTEKMGLNGIKNLSVYLAGSNLFVLSDFRLKDPETSLFDTDNIAAGFSRGEYPSARTITIGTKVTF